MKVNQTNLVKALSAIKPATLSKVDECAKYIKAIYHPSDNTLSLQGYDYQTFIRTTIDVEDAPSENLGFICAFNSFFSLISKLKGEIVLSVGKVLLIQEGNNKFKLPLIDSSLLPTIPDQYLDISIDDFENSFKVSSPNLIKEVASKASVDVSKGVIRSVIFTPGAIAATDGFRLIEVKSSLFEALDQEYLVPASFLLGLDVSFLGSDWFIGFKDSTVYALREDKKAVFACILSSGDYPKYQALIPERFEATLDIDQKSLDANIKKAMILSDTPTVKLVFSSNTLTVQSAGAAGDCKLPLSIEYSGEGIEFAFNQHFLSAALKTASQSRSTFEFNSETQPVIIRKGIEENKLKYEILDLIMPVQLRN